MEHEFLAITEAGIEDVLAKEVYERFRVKVKTDVNKVYFRSGLNAVYEGNLSLRCMNKLILLLERASFRSLDDLYSMAEGIDYEWLMEPNQTFKVKVRRKGEHPFTSLEAASRIGQAIIDSYASSTGRKLKVNLKAPDVEFWALIKGDEAQIGVNTTGESLHKRRYRVYQHPASIKTTLACGLIYLSGWRFSEPFLDPMCGGGTIPIEAALMARNVPLDAFGRKFAFFDLKFFNEEDYAKAKAKLGKGTSSAASPIYGIDISRRHIIGAKENAKSAGVGDTVEFILGDGLNLNALKLEPKFIVVNPPYGVRLGCPALKEFYFRMIDSVRKASPKATIVAVTTAIKEFKAAARRAGAQLTEERRTFHGEAPGSIFKLEV